MDDRFPGAILRTYGELVPRIDDTAWIAPGVSVIGDVEIGAESSVFYGSVLRGDVHFIQIGARTNLQDQATDNLYDNQKHVLSDLANLNLSLDLEP